MPMYLHTHVNMWPYMQECSMHVPRTSCIVHMSVSVHTCVSLVYIHLFMCPSVCLCVHACWVINSACAVTQEVRQARWTLTPMDSVVAVARKGLRCPLGRQGSQSPWGRGGVQLWLLLLTALIHSSI